MVYLSNKISYKNHIELWTFFAKINKLGVLIRAGGVDKIFEK